jgi:hypothetical protein
MGIILNGEHVTEIVLKRADGRPVNLLDIGPDDFTIEYLAHTLSLVNRYGGHTTRPFNVALHSILVSLLLPGYAQFEGLTHDLTEGTGIGDLVNPVKKFCSEYRIIEDFIRLQLSRIYGFSAIESRIVKAADVRAWQLEDHFLRGAELVSPITETEQEMCNFIIAPFFTEEESARMFLEQFHYLKGHGNRLGVH